MIRRCRMDTNPTTDLNSDLVAWLDMNDYRAGSNYPVFGHAGTGGDRYFEQRAHPDTVCYLWKQLLQDCGDCELLVHGWPALAHPNIGVIFATTTGIWDIALRLPTDLHTIAAQNGATRLEIPIKHGSKASPEVAWFSLDAPNSLNAEWARAAYQHAARVVQ